MQLPLPALWSGDVEHDQLHEVGEIRSDLLDPLPDAAHDGGDLRPGVVRESVLAGRIGIGLAGDRDQAVPAHDLAHWRDFARHQPFIGVESSIRRT